MRVDYYKAAQNVSGFLGESPENSNPQCASYHLLPAALDFLITDTNDAKLAKFAEGIARSPQALAMVRTAMLFMAHKSDNLESKEKNQQSYHDLAKKLEDFFILHGVPKPTAYVFAEALEGVNNRSSRHSARSRISSGSIFFQ